jgi:hypothetical protein
MGSEAIMGTPIEISIKQICSLLTIILKSNGFSLLLYRSKTSASVYLKLDYGACGSIRISNHPGKKKYRYTYNIHTHQQGEEHRVDRGVRRHYYGVDAIAALVLQLQIDRTYRVATGMYKKEILAGMDKYISAQCSGAHVGFFSGAILM